MGAREAIDAREAEIVKLAQSASDCIEIRRQVAEIVEGEAFKGSSRSARFLNYIVDHAISGDFDALKERVIGVELFGRAGSWNTGEDAIVRVTASDVRRRLLQHYGRSGSHSKFRLGLPSGSYVPEFIRVENSAGVSTAEEPSVLKIKTSDSNEAALEPSEQPFLPSAPNRPFTLRPALLWSVILLLLMIVGLLSWDITRGGRPQAQLVQTAATFPWPVFFRPGGETEIIASDPNIAEIQGYTGGQLTAADYANHHYYVGPNGLTPEQDRFCRIVLRGDKATMSDMTVTANLAVLAALNGRPLVVRGARDVQIADLRTNESFIILGSPRSNPWFSLFNEQLDFRFAFNKQMQTEYITNVRPRANEQRDYLSSAMGWDTGQSYALIAFVRNPDQNGQVLLLAGATAEGTAAAGKVVTDPSRLTPMLRRCGVTPSSPLRHFELLMRLNMIAGSSDDITYAACHLLPDSDSTN